MSQIAYDAEEYCPSCGSWVEPSEYNSETGFCITCSPVSLTPECVRCGGAMKDASRTTCHTCRQELWLERYSDELEYFIVVKGYSLTMARVTVTKMIRPVCQCCGKQIKGGTPGESLFCKSNRKCHSMYGKYRRLLSKGLTNEEALATLKDPQPKGGTLKFYQVKTEP